MIFFNDSSKTKINNKYHFQSTQCYIKILVCPVFNNIRVNRLGNIVRIFKFFVQFLNTPNPNFNRQDSFKHTDTARSSPIAIQNRYIHNLNNNYLALLRVLEI